MKIYRDLPDGARYHYYVEHGDATVMWYPEMAWQSRPVAEPQGRLLSEGTVERVLFEVRDALPPDLLKQVRASVTVRPEPAAAGAPRAAGM
ncbi:MAG: hypothetical protein ABIL09_02530 [Gemmatimonadota bacterium]